MGLTTDYRLGDLETAVMELCWQRDEVTVRDIWSALQPTRALAYTTVMTIMQRLATKGILSARKQGKTYYYQATAQPDELIAQRAQAAVRDVLSNFGEVAITQFLKELDGLDPQRLAALRGLSSTDEPSAS